MAEEDEAPYLTQWHADTLIACRRYRDALDALPDPGFEKRWSVVASKALCIKLELNAPISPSDVVGLFGPTFTKFGRENAAAVAEYIAIQLRERQIGASLIASWADDAHELEHGLNLFNGHASYMVIKPPRGLHFGYSKAAETFCSDLIRDAENTWRDECGIPRVGEGWVAETELFYRLKAALPDHRVQHHARPIWLGRQHLDIFFPDLLVAVEYQGDQHDKPVAFFGGELAFAQTQQRDAKKLALCRRHGVRLIYVRAGYDFAALVEKIIVTS